MKNQQLFEEKFGKYLDDDELEEAIFCILKSAFRAGWDAVNELV